MSNHTYQNQLKLKQLEKLKSTMTYLPKFCDQFFVGIEHHTQPGTQLRYAIDLKLFFRYIHEKNSNFESIRDIPIDILNKITSFEIEQFLSYIKVYKDSNGKIRTNGRPGIKSKLAAIRSLYHYFYKHGLIKSNISLLVDMPYIEEKNIIRLDNNQVEQLLDNIETGTRLNGRELLWNKLYKTRDYAVISLLLGTGIRVSECVGIDLSDINFNDCSLQIIRKGGNEDLVYFSDEVRIALLAYFNDRIITTTKDPDETAFFLSKCKTRLSVRSIQELVNKYTKNIKKISPHKLRTTFGTNLYIATKDIYLVADTLGHTNVETTRRHYADIPAQEKRKVRNTLKLRSKRK